MKNTYINPFADWSFKRFFGQEVNKDLLISFLNEVLAGEQHIRDVTFLDKEQLGETKGDRNVIYDIYCTTDSGKQFIVEIQNQYQANFIDRSIYYTARSVVGQGRKGSDWKYSLTPVYTICLMNFNVQEGTPKKFRTDVILADRENGDPVSDKIRLIYLMLPLFPIKRAEDCKTNFERWIYILTNMETMEQMPFTDIDKVFKRLDEVGRHLSLNKEENEQYEESLKAYRDTRNCFLTAIELGEKKGIEIGCAEGVKLGRAEGIEIGQRRGVELGRSEGIFQTAQNLKSLGVHIETIMQATGLSREEIEAIPVIDPHP